MTGQQPRLLGQQNIGQTLCEQSVGHVLLVVCFQAGRQARQSKAKQAKASQSKPSRAKQTPKQAMCSSKSHYSTTPKSPKAKSRYTSSTSKTTKANRRPPLGRATLSPACILQGQLPYVNVVSQSPPPGVPEWGNVSQMLCSSSFKMFTAGAMLHKTTYPYGLHFLRGRFETSRFVKHKVSSRLTKRSIHVAMRLV